MRTRAEVSLVCLRGVPTRATGGARSTWSAGDSARVAVLWLGRASIRLCWLSHGGLQKRLVVAASLDELLIQLGEFIYKKSV